MSTAVINNMVTVHWPDAKQVFHLPVTAESTARDIRSHLPALITARMPQISEAYIQSVIYPGWGYMEDSVPIANDRLTSHLLIVKVLTTAADLENRMSVWCRALTGARWRLECLGSDSLQQFMQTIYRLKGIPPHQQRWFCYQGNRVCYTPENQQEWAEWYRTRRELQANRTLTENGIKGDSEIEVVLRSRGGGGTLSKEQRATRSFLHPGQDHGINSRISRASRWRTGFAGLNVEGICSNVACVARHHEVICHIGSGKLDAINGRAACPMCAAPVELTNCLFSDCHWFWYGERAPAADGVRRRCWSTTRQTADWPFCQHSLSDLKGHDSQPWLIFCIVTVLSKLDPNEEDLEMCPCCLDPILRDRFVTSCGHVFHGECALNWEDSCRTSTPVIQTTCPMCRSEWANIVEGVSRENDDFR